MTNPQVEDGHVDVATEIAEEFAKKKITGREWQIIWFVLRKTWGWKKKRDWITLQQFETATGIPKKKCFDLLRSLERKKIILVFRENGRKTYEFNKHYNLWEIPKNRDCPQKRGKASPKIGTRSKSLRNTKDTLTKDTKTYTVVFDFWNSQPILIKHRSLTQTMISAINGRLKDYSQEEILETIDNYAKVIESDDHYWTFKWPLDLFLKRGFSQFVTDANPLENFRKSQKDIDAIREEKEREKKKKEARERYLQQKAEENEKKKNTISLQDFKSRQAGERAE